MVNKLNPLGFFAFTGWFILFIPGIIGYYKGYSYESIRQNYVGIIGYHSPLIESLLLFVVFTLSFLLYIKSIKAYLNTELFKVVSGATVLTLMLTLLPPFACEDVYYYIATGQMQSVYNINPYLKNAHQIVGWQSDPFLSTSGWGYLLNMYGPLWTKVTQWVVSLAGDNLWLAVWLFKMLAGSLHLFNMMCIGVIAKHLNSNMNQAMIIYGWNPLLLFELPGHAHNDALVISFIILAVFTLIYGKALLTLPFLTLSILVKYIPILLIPLFALWLIVKRKYSILLRSLILSSLLVPIAWLSYWQGLQTLAGIYRQFDFYSIKSLHFLVFSTFYKWFPKLPRDLLFDYTSKGLTLVFMLTFLHIMINFSRQKPLIMRNLLLASLSVLISFLLISNKWYQPWYISWLIPLAAIINLQNPITLIVLLLSYTAELSRIPQVLLGNTGILVQIITFFTAWLPIVLYVAKNQYIDFEKNKN